MKFPLLALITVILTIVNGIAGKREFGRERTKKIALVIGVQNYQFIDPLKNALRDAAAMDSVLTFLGFEVVRVVDPSSKEFSRKIETFGEKMKEAGTCLFYFGGYAAEIKGENFLFPGSFNPNKQNNTLLDAYPLKKLFAKCSAARILTSIIIIDAGCRSPKMRGFLNKGLASVMIPNSTFLVYASMPGTNCNNVENGLLTNAILKNITKPDISIDQLFNKVAKEVKHLSENQQIPYRTSNLDREYFFNVNSNGTMNIDSASPSKPTLYRNQIYTSTFPLSCPPPIRNYSNTFTAFLKPDERPKKITA